MRLKEIRYNTSVTNVGETYDDTDLVSRVTNIENIVDNYITNKPINILEGYAEFVNGYNFGNIINSSTFRRDNITSFQRSRDMVGINYRQVGSTSNNQKPIYVYCIDNDLYWYSEAEYVYLNFNSSTMFMYFNNIRTIDLTGINTVNVSDMSQMFSYTKNLTQLTLGNEFYTNECTQMNYMFANSTYEAVQNIDFSKFNVSKVRYMNSMFYNLIRYDTSTSYYNLNINWQGTMADRLYMDHMFYQSYYIRTLNLYTWNMSQTSYISVNSTFMHLWYINSIIISNKFPYISSSTGPNAFNGCSQLPNYNNSNVSYTQWTHDSYLTKLP